MTKGLVDEPRRHNSIVGVLSEACCEDNILGLDTLQLRCHVFYVAGEDDEVMLDVRRVYFLLTSP